MVPRVRIPLSPPFYKRMAQPSINKNFGIEVLKNPRRVRQIYRIVNLDSRMAACKVRVMDDPNHNFQDSKFERRKAATRKVNGVAREGALG